MRSNCFLVFFFILLSTSAMKAADEKDGYKIGITAHQKGDSIAHLARYWNGEIYSIDSVRLSKDGTGTLQSDKELEGGQYIILIKPNIQLDLLIDKEQSNISMYIDEKDFTKSTISGSKDSELLWKYLIAINKEKEYKEQTEKKLENKKLSKQKREEYLQRISAIDEAVHTITNKFVNENPGTWFASFVKGMDNQIGIPHPNPKSQAEGLENRAYAKEHAFDNIDLQDPRIWNTNYFITYLDHYMNHLVENDPDSLAVAASRLVAKTEGDSICFERMLSRLINTSMKSDVMGRENVWAKLYEDYIFEKEIGWISDKQQYELRAEYEKIKNNRIGMTAHNLTFTDINGNIINTNGTGNEFTVLYFYTPTCSHCQHETPLIHDEIYEKYKDKGLRFIAVDIDSDTDVWKTFVNDKKLTGWINCSDPEYKSEYWMYYDTAKVPAIFVMDKDNKILAKKIDKATLEKILEFYIKD